MEKNGGSAGTVVMAFAVGAIAGAAVALLYAPDSGEETRRKIAVKARERKDQAQAAAGRGREFLQRQRDNISEAVQAGRDAFQQARKEPL